MTIEIKSKRCSACKTVFYGVDIAKSFHRHPYTPDKLQSQCKKCAIQRATAHYYKKKGAIK